MVLEVRVLFGAVWSQPTRRVRKGYILPVALKKIVVLVTDSRRRSLVFGSLPTKDRFPLGGIFRAEGNFLFFKDQSAKSGCQRTKEIILVENGPQAQFAKLQEFWNLPVSQIFECGSLCQIRFQYLQTTKS